MNISQALVAVGGRASRLRSGGASVPSSKSFLVVNHRPMLYWCLLAIRNAGIRHIVIAGDQAFQRCQAELVLNSLPVSFDSVAFFQDSGLGVHGLPYQAGDLLDRSFIFECGHSIMTPEHYRRMIRAKTIDNVVFSAFIPHPSNLRQSVYRSRGQVRAPGLGRSQRRALAHPLVIDQEYVHRLPEVHFQVSKMISLYSSASRLSYVFSSMPPEFDVMAELRDSLTIYTRYLTGLESNGDAALFSSPQSTNHWIRLAEPSKSSTG